MSDSIGTTETGQLFPVRKPTSKFKEIYDGTNQFLKNGTKCDVIVGNNANLSNTACPGGKDITDAYLWTKV
jgi:hypothetical protein